VVVVVDVDVDLLIDAKNSLPSLSAGPNKIDDCTHDELSSGSATPL